MKRKGKESEESGELEMAEKNFSVEKLDAMFQAQVEAGVAHFQEDSPGVKKIKHLLQDIERGGTAGWEKLVHVLADEPKFSVENFSDIISLLLDGLSRSEKVTHIALEALWQFLNQCPESFQLSPEEVGRLVFILESEILRCGTGSHNLKDAGFLCLKTVVLKFFKDLGDIRAVLVRLFAVESGQLPLYDWMIPWLRRIIGKNDVNALDPEVAKKLIKDNPLLFYLSMIAVLDSEENFDGLESVNWYATDFDQRTFCTEWGKLLDKGLGENFFGFVRGFLFESVNLQPVCHIGAKLVAELAVMEVPPQYWEDFEDLMIKNLELGDFDKSNQILLILGAIMQPWSFGEDLRLKKLINKLFPIAFQRLETHKSAVVTVCTVMKFESDCVRKRQGRIQMMQQLKKWIKSRNSKTSTPAMTTTDDMKSVLSELIKFEEKWGRSGTKFLNEMKRLASPSTSDFNSKKIKPEKRKKLTVQQTS